MEIRSERLLLRPWHPDDVPALAIACQEEQVARWIPVIPSPYTEDDAAEFIELSEGRWERGEAFCFAVCDLESSALVGSIAARTQPFDTAHIGYWVTKDARGRGVATEALRALCGWLVETLDMKRLELVTDPENAISQRVAEKAGFTREGILRSALGYRDGTRRDSLMFSLLPDELGSP